MFKKLLVYLIVLNFFTSCAHKYVGREPDFTIQDQKDKKEQIQEYKLFKLEPYSIPSPHYTYLKFRGRSTHPDDLEHVMEATKKGTLARWKEHHWGAYLAWISAIPFGIFLTKTIKDFSFTNLFLFGTSASAFGYGSYMEQQYKNSLVREHNRELKIKLNLIQTDF